MFSYTACLTLDERGAGMLPPFLQKDVPAWPVEARFVDLAV